MIFNTELTFEQRLAREISAINGMALTTYQQLVLQHRSMMICVWANPNGFTPQQIFDAYGTNGAALFMKSAEMVGYIASQEDALGIPLDERYTVAMPYQYTINGDGSVTVGEPL